ncbi:NAD(+) diphosphatase [Propionibacterium australiense]|uniref:NAD(+) diphosphatase n=1 Tax=Propionibacterium australiense TaxID=119981 RepID=A0A383S583_9ACTN|nr:NAD(+) diphosphatase [Propionibacterium australiense]RLP11697.1 NAD(+) diphosphatase [Propionibacterium australiense]SYZ32436.1 NAD+ diphosphatase [Propionibacterium australiense]VEH90213.1 NADH pyrophosphatase [Propionibacterium australiense]
MRSSQGRGAVRDPYAWDLATSGGPPNLDHASEIRGDAQRIRQAWREPGARIVCLDDEGRFEDEPFGRPITPADGEEPGDDDVFLGRLEGHPWFARRDAGPYTAVLRNARLTPGEREVASAAQAILNWVRVTRRCVRCGGELVRTRGGFAAECAQCGHETFPRTDPAIICAVLDYDNRLFLAHQGSWERGRVSVLAGFVEAGETVEQAVHREIAEEARLRIASLRYLGSQPWPMPRSLMLSFVARSDSPGRVDGQELSWGGWYTRGEVNRLTGTGSLVLPPGASVGHHLIRAWLEDRLPGPED